MAKSTDPNSIRIRAASEIVKKMNQLLPNTIKGALLFGSTAARMAGRDSDVDIVIIASDGSKVQEVQRIFEQARSLALAGVGQKIKRNSVSCDFMAQSTFEKGKDFISGFYHVVLKDGSIPIFGAEYLKQFKGKLWNPPSATKLYAYANRSDHRVRLAQGTKKKNKQLKRLWKFRRIG